MPKCLVEVAGASVIAHQLKLLEAIPNVRVVVGFMEHEVMKHVRSIRDDVVFVRNAEYLTTSNTRSIHLAVCDLSAPYISLDGDCLITASEFAKFLGASGGPRSVVGVTPSKTEDAVFVVLDDDDMVTKFVVGEAHPYEWSGFAYWNGVSIPGDKDDYVYRVLEEHLPLPCVKFDCFEIDTPSDLEIARHHFRPD